MVSFKRADGRGKIEQQEDCAAWSGVPRFHSLRWVSFRVGCDGCGLHPIQGQRFRCLDCPEEIGFDLCGGCHAHSRNGRRPVRGRFNQAHQASHRMVLVEPRVPRMASQPPEVASIIGTEDLVRIQAPSKEVCSRTCNEDMQ